MQQQQEEDEEEEFRVPVPLLQVVCFSMDRVFQLSEYLRTLHAHVRYNGVAMAEQQQAPFARVSVICRCTSAEIRAHYEEIKRQYAALSVTFLYESDTHSFADYLLLSIATVSPYLLFNVDDAFYFADVELADTFAFLGGDKHGGLASQSCTGKSTWSFAFHVKLAPSIWRSHLTNKPMLPLPPMQTVVTMRKDNNDDGQFSNVIPFDMAYHVFDPARGTLDWNYPWELSGSVYLRSTVERVVTEIQAQFGEQGINHPNHLELRGHQVVQRWRADSTKLQCACSLSPKMHVFAINQVQDVFNNRLYEEETDSHQDGAHGGGGNGDLTNLLRLYKANETLDEEYYRRNRLSSVHIGTLVLKASTATVQTPSTELVSVVIPVFNVAKYVEQALRSMMNQSYRHLEILVVDDASTDATPEIIARLQAQDPRIRCLRNATNLGVAASLNRGFAAAKGASIARMDGDDVSLPQRIERQLLYLRKNPQVAIVGTSVLILREEENLETDDQQVSKLETAVYPTSPLITRWRMLFGCFVGHPTVMLRREVLDILASDAGDTTLEYYSTSQTSSEDYELWLRCLYSHKLTIQSMGDALVIHRKHPTNVSTMRREKQINETQAIATKFIQTIVNSPSIADKVHGGVPSAHVLPLLDANSCQFVEDLSSSIKVLQKLQSEICSSLKSSSKAVGDEVDCEKEYIHQDAASREGELALKSMLLDPIRGSQLWSAFATQHPQVSRNAFEKLFKK